MKRRVILWSLVLACGFATAFSASGAPAAATPAAKEASPAKGLQGSWGGTIEFGKFKFRLVLHIKQEPDGKISVTMDHPDRGAKGLPVAAVLFNHPAVRFEFDDFQGAYTGKLNPDGDAITGTMDAGPRPMELVFRRLKAEELKEPERLYTFKAGEERDARGYWKGKVPLGPNPTRVNLKIGKLPDGKFDAKLDLLDLGMKDVPASSISQTNGGWKLEWQMFQITLEGKLEEEASKLVATVKQGARSIPEKFERIEKPEQAIPDDVSFEPGNLTEEIFGYWKGVLETPGPKLRLSLRVGRDKQGQYVVAMNSADQGARDLLASSATFTKPDAKLEWSRINGTFTAKLSADGQELAGEWKQGPQGLPLKLTRTTAADLDK